MPLLFKECPLLPGNRLVALTHFESNKDSHLSNGNLEVGTKSSKKSQEKVNLSKGGGGAKRGSKKRGDQLIKKFICEETCDASQSQNCLSPLSSLLPKKEKASKARVD